MTTIRHRDTDNKVLFDFPRLEALSDSNDRVVFLSQRDYYLLLNAIEHIGKFRTRVYVSKIDETYTLCSDAEWQEFKQFVEDLENNLGGWPVANEYLLRIAEALEEMVIQQDGATINLNDVLEALGIDPTEEEADILEAIQYLVNFPGFPGIDLKMPIGQWIASFMEGRYRSAHLQLLRDISISQRGQTVALGGVDFAGLYDTMGETADSMLVSAGYAGKAYWIWRWIDNDQIPGWLGWLTTISGFLLGSIRNAAYDLVEAVGNLDLLGIEEAIQDQTITSIVNCNNCTSADINNHLSPPWHPTYVTVEDDSSWSDEGEPPVSDDATWEEIDSEDDYKCQAAHFIVGWLQAFYGHSTWNLSPTDNLITLADKFALVLAAIPPIGASLDELSSIVGLTLSYITGGSTDIFETINEKITDRYDDLVCELYNAETSGEARDGFMAIMEEEAVSSLGLSGLRVFLTINNIMANLFYQNDQTSTLIALETDVCPCGGDALYQVVTEICTATTDGEFTEGNEVTIESCEGNYFGTTRAGMNAAGFPIADTNRWVEFVSATFAGTCYVTLVDAGTPDGGNHRSAAFVAGIAGMYSGFQICRSDASDTTPFEVVIKVYESEP